ncbi:MAG: ion channel [Sedimentibacter sp.]
MNRKTIIIYNITVLFNLYFFIAASFSIIYIILEYVGLGFVIDHYSSVPHQKRLIDVITRSIYFSYMTLFAVGYGDMTPFGFSKAVAIIQSFTGYIIPYVIMLNYIIYKPKNAKFLRRK